MEVLPSTPTCKFVVPYDLISLPSSYTSTRRPVFISASLFVLASILAMLLPIEVCFRIDMFCLMMQVDVWSLVDCRKSCPVMGFHRACTLSQACRIYLCMCNQPGLSKTQRDEWVKAWYLGFLFLSTGSLLLSISTRADHVKTIYFGTDITYYCHK